MQLRDYQEAALTAIDDRFRAGVNRQLLSGATGCGKCLGAGTPVLLYSGEIKFVEDVQVGELLMGPNSQPRRVLSTCSGFDQLYRVVPTKGDPYVVNQAHILSLKMTGLNGKSVSGYRSGDIVNISITDYVAESATFHHCAKGWRAGVEFASQSDALLVDPYYLGLWLGDGVSASCQVVNVDMEVVEFLHGYAHSLGMECHSYDYAGRVPAWHIAEKGRLRGPGQNRLQNALIRLRVIKNKHIPLRYLTSTRCERLRLLAGLIDSDGHLRDGGGFEITLKSETLSRDIAYLCRSLGFAAYLRRCQKSSQTGRTGNYWRISISGNLDIVPTQIPRKKSAPRLQKKDPLLVGIRVEPAGFGRYYGFQIDGDGLFLLGDFTVTHNTEIFTALIKSKIASGENSLVLAHRDRLVSQAAERIRRHVGYSQVSLVNADRKDWWSPCVVATVQSAASDKQLRRAPKFQNIIVDECHRSGAGSYKKVIENLLAPGGLLLGVTATPNRTDKKSLIPQVYQELVYEIGMQDLIDRGFLSKVVGKEIKLPIDFSRIKTQVSTDGIRDYKADEIKAAFEEANWLERITEGWKLLAGDRRTIIFVPPGVVDGRGCGMAHSLAEYMRLQGIAAAAVDGTTRQSEQDRVIADFTSGTIQVLVNVNIFTEGLDIPPIDCVLFARPTTSSIIYSQAIGRGTRLFEGKENCLVVDVTGITEQLAKDGQTLMTLGRILPTREQILSEKALRIKAAKELIRRLWRKRVTLKLVDERLEIRGPIGPKDRRKVDDLESEIKEILTERDNRSNEEETRQGERRPVNTALLLSNEIEIREIDFERAAMRFKWQVDPVDRVAILEYGGAEYKIRRPDPQGDYLYGDPAAGLEGHARSYFEAKSAVERYIAAYEIRKRQIFSNPNAPWRTGPMTDRQKEILNKFRISYSDTITKGEASDLIDAAFNRRKRA